MSKRIDPFYSRSYQMLRRWSGSASVTVYVRDPERDLAALSELRSRVDFHLVLADLHQDRVYPVNTLRNVAINKCRTPWILLMDADFVPSVGMYEYFLERLAGWEKANNSGDDFDT